MELCESIPSHLEPFIVKQDPSIYTWIDHASWRYIMNVSRVFFKDFAHENYIQGLVDTGISTDRIPKIEEMDHCLRRYGWRAVAVSGFIPPSVFMEFQSLGILPIACDMRKLEHLSYTPAPDIVHEAAGHAPLLSNPNYSTYLRAYGTVAKKAIISMEDMKVYWAVRNLSEVKENPQSTPSEIQKAQQDLDEATGSVTHLSEAALLARMNWWTVEYGLVGSMEQPKIYGAGLLSSLGESYHCLDSTIKKIPFSLDCIHYAYDITKPQPQLFVAESFESLTQAIEDFSKQMAFKQGGKTGLVKALESKYTCTVELDSKLQISGELSEVEYNQKNQPIFIKFTGPSQLSVHEVEIENHGPETHAEGFSMPLGKIKEMPSFTSSDLPKNITIHYESGFLVQGELQKTQTLSHGGQILTFKNCTVQKDGKIYFDPSWGNYDLIFGEEVVSVFGGAADRASYLMKTNRYQILGGFHKTNLTSENKFMNELYRRVREVRDQKTYTEEVLKSIYSDMINENRHEWLLHLEIYELVLDLHTQGVPCSSFKDQLRQELLDLMDSTSTFSELIERGLNWVEKK